MKILVSVKRVVRFMGGQVSRRQSPDGHFKFPHLWPVKFPQAGRTNYQSFDVSRAMRAAASEGAVVSGGRGLGDAARFSDISENGFALGWDRIVLSTPVYEGDTLYSESEVIEVRPSNTRPAQGIVKVRTRGINQDGKVVIDYARSVMVWKRGFAPLHSSFPVIQNEKT